MKQREEGIKRRNNEIKSFTWFCVEGEKKACVDGYVNGQERFIQAKFLLDQVSRSPR